MSNDVNCCNISGVVLDVQEYGTAKKLSIGQTVAGRFDSTYVVIMDKPLSNVMDVGVGDEVLILSAICYVVNGECRFRVSGTNQFFITNKVLNQGTVEAEDMFI